MKDITLSEFLSIIHNNDIDKIEKIENVYGISIRYDNGLWYGDKIVIENNYNIINTKEEVFFRYDFLKHHPDIDNKLRSQLLDIIVNNNWYEEYISECSNE